MKTLWNHPQIVCATLLFSLLFALPANAAPAWQPAEAAILADWIERASDEAIDLPDDRASALFNAIESGDRTQLDAMSQAAALDLLRAWRGRCCGASRPRWWHIDGTMSDAAMLDALDKALEANRLDQFLRSIRPSHPYYIDLVQAYSRTIEPSRRTVIEKNLARWRWLPAQMGERYLLVNIAAQKLTLWENGAIAGEWRVIIGKPATRTPVFTTQVSGVVLNPWWEIPSSIAAEGIASFVRRSPTAARARGYIRQNGRYRQMPGENNALGRMKLVMPNPYSVYLHDTSRRELFAEARRAFSHGCVRVDRALEFASVLLNNSDWTLSDVEQHIATETTKTVDLSIPIPLYVTYFTAEPDADGDVRFFEDIYNRDGVTVAKRDEQLSTGIYGSPQAPGFDNLPHATGASSCPK